MAPYIGEVCRYLLSTSVVPEETQHNVRAMFGNGLRQNIWAEFRDRFNLKDIYEFYGSTEGNCMFMNIDNTVGAIGFTGVIEPQALTDIILPNALVKVDDETGEIIRDSETGFCIQCQPGEPGELIGKIVKGDPAKDFGGYSDREESNKKVLHNVFSVGDRYFRSGDFISMDEFGNMYFKDRKGDTFR